MSKSDAAVPHNVAATESDRRTISDWAADHQIDAWLLPLSSRKDDPIELVRTFTEYLDDAGAYQATFATTEVGRQFHSGYGQQMRKLFLLREVGSTNRKNRYVNPNYAHLGHHEPAIESNDERLAFYDFFKSSAFLEAEWLAANWGISPDSATRYLRRRGYDLPSQLQSNRARLGRTLYTVHEWTDRSYRDLGKAMPGPMKTLTTWMHRYGRQADDWSPPERPTDEPWFKRFAGMGDQ